MLYIKNATIYTPQHRIEDGAVLTDGGHIVAVGTSAEVPCPAEAQVFEAGGLLLTPGFIDLQLNGGFGHDFTADPMTIWPVARRLPCYGVTSFLPTIITSPLDRVAAGQQVIMQGRPEEFTGATPLGLHVEGPFLNTLKKGAHNPAYLRLPSEDAVTGWSPSTAVRMVTLAPELPGALDVIRLLAERGVLVSAGHSMATFAEAQAGFDAGVRYGTHLFNAMPPLQHRAPGLPGALLTDPRPFVGFINDGVHTHSAIVSLVWQMAGPDRLNLVTDAMAALGMPPGKHLLGDSDVYVDQASARLADGTLAGSILSMDEALRNLLGLTGCQLEEALPSLTTNAARAIGLQLERGQVAPSFAADLVLLSPDLHIRRTVVAGKFVYIAE